MKESICSQRGSVYSFLLTALKNGEKYAYEIGKAVKEISGGQFILKEASLYSGLKRLEAQGFLTSYIKEQENGLNRRYYKLTESGIARLNNINFSWDNSQKETISKAFSEQLAKIENDSTEEKVQNTSTLNSITISSENETLTKHYISENQQDLFELISKENGSNSEETSIYYPQKTSSESDASKLIAEKEHSHELKNSAPTPTFKVDELEFDNLKNNYKTQNTSFLDKINSEDIKPFNYESKKVQSTINVEPKEKPLEVNETEPVKNIENNFEPKINIDEIFGDLCVKSTNSDNTENNISIIEEKSTELNTTKKEELKEDNINCTLVMPAKNENTQENTAESSSNDELFTTKPIDEILCQKEKNLNELFETKQTLHTSITMNNSVQYANNKIDFEKPSFESSFNNLNGNIYEIREFVPIEQKNIQSSFFNINKLNLFSGLITLVLGLLLITLNYLIFDKTPIASMSTLQLSFYISGVSILVLYAIFKTFVYYLNKHKMVKNIDVKTNLLFKFLFALCIMSTLLIVYKFYELNIVSAISYLVILPVSIVMCFIVEEFVKICISKYVKS